MAAIDNTAVVYRGQPPTAATSLWTAKNNGEMIKEIICCNTTPNNANITIYIVPNGASASVANAIAYNKQVPANDLLVFSLCTDMAVGDFIAASNGTQNAVTLTITNYQK